MSSELSLFDASTFLLVSVAILFAVASLLAFLENHCGSRTARSPVKTFLGSAVGLLVIYQFHLLSEVSTRVSSASGKGIYRLECLRSRKGGKRPFGDTSDDYLNPCYNHIETNRTDDDESSGQDLAVANRFGSSSLCSSTGGNGDASSSIEPYISAARDCNQAQSGQCTLTQPCIPCELARREEFQQSQHGWSRCQACSVRNNNGTCNFKEGVGPYCWKDAGSWEVVPCQSCCTESMAMFDERGVCY